MRGEPSLAREFHRDGLGSAGVFPESQRAVWLATIGQVTGLVAEWSCSGLQIRVRRFDSDPGLQVQRHFSESRRSTIVYPLRSSSQTFLHAAPNAGNISVDIMKQICCNTFP